MVRVRRVFSESRFRLAVLLVAAGAVSTTGWAQTLAQPVLDSGAVEAELRAFAAAHAAAIDAKDVEGILRFYATDLITVPGGQSILRGRDWIRSAVVELFQNYDVREEFTLADVRVFGDRVAATYRYSRRMTPLAGGMPVAETGSGMCILRRSAPGKWQFEWNAYAPDAKPKVAQE